MGNPDCMTTTNKTTDKQTVW